MHPTLFSIGPINVDSYYLIWGAALCAAVLWMRQRCVTRYGISFDDASDVLFWTIIGVFFGSTIGGYIEHWRRYAADPYLLLRFWESGLSSGPGFIVGGLAGLVKIRKLKLSAVDFADAAALPCAMLLAVGRWGCFLSGCCAGIPTDLPCGVRFPYAPDTAVFPTQIFESIAAFIIAAVLYLLERRMDANGRRDPAILWPVFLMLYGSYRVVFDFLRAGDRILGLRVGQYSGAIMIVTAVVWVTAVRSARLRQDAR